MKTVVAAFVFAIIVIALCQTPAPAQSHSPSYNLSEEKRKLIRRLSERICQIATQNDFYRIKRILKKAGNHYIGEEITVEEAYPYIRCDTPLAGNIDLLRIAAEDPNLQIFYIDFISYLTEEVADKTFFPKLLMCRRDFGYACLDIFEHIEKNEKRASPAFVRPYNDLKRINTLLLMPLMEEAGGPVRDPKFCREVLDEPLHCQTDARR